ncbi:MAG TPA: HAD family hydrolase [Trichocoleus sp.]
MPQLQALIFDVDGTLADTERDGHRVAFNRAFADAGLDWDWSVEQYGELLTVTGGKERMQYYIDRYRPDFQVPAQFEGTLKEFIAKLHANKTTHYTTLLREGGIPLRPGVKRLLAEARSAGMRLAIATTTTPDNVTALLESTLGSDAQSWFEVIAAGDIVPAKKPAPDIYFYALQALELPPEACIAFEDSQHGLTSARQANLPTVITVNDYTRHQDFTDAVLVLNHLGEPDEPFEPIAGDPLNHRYFDLELAQKLC